MSSSRMWLKTEISTTRVEPFTEIGKLPLADRRIVAVVPEMEEPELCETDIDLAAQPFHRGLMDVEPQIPADAAELADDAAKQSALAAPDVQEAAVPGQAALVDHAPRHFPRRAQIFLVRVVPAATPAQRDRGQRHRILCRSRSHIRTRRVKNVPWRRSKSSSR